MQVGQVCANAVPLRDSCASPFSPPRVVGANVRALSSLSICSLRLCGALVECKNRRKCNKPRAAWNAHFCHSPNRSRKDLSSVQSLTDLACAWYSSSTSTSSSPSSSLILDVSLLHQILFICKNLVSELYWFRRPVSTFLLSVDWILRMKGV